MLVGALTSKHIDYNSNIINDLIALNGQKKALSQRIAFTVIKLENATSEAEYNLYRIQLTNSVSDFSDIVDITESLHEKDSDLRNRINIFYKKIGSDNGNNGEILTRFTKLSQTISDYFQNNGFNTAVTSDIHRQISVIDGFAIDVLLNIFHETANIYAETLKTKQSDERSIKNILIIFFTVLIFVIIAISFYPLHIKTKKLLKDLCKQKKQFQIDLDRLDLAAKGTSTGIWDWNIETNELHWSNVTKEILGLSQDDNKTYNVDFLKNLIHPDDLDNYNDAIKNHIKNNDIFFFQGRLKHQKGYYLWVESRGQVLHHENGQAYRMVGSIQDYTVQKEAEIERDLFIQSIETSDIAFAIINLNSTARNFTYASPAFCELTGYDYSRIINSNMNMFSGPDTNMNDLDQIDYALINQKELCIKMNSYKSSGESYHNNITLRPIFIQDEFSNYFIVTFSDLTETVQHQKQEIERQRNESLGSLAGSVAHEINNLLMPMTMAGDILEDELKEDCDPFAKEQIKTIVNYANQAKAIVQGILTFSRKETEDLQKLNLYEELQEATQFIESLLSTKTTLRLHKSDDKDVITMINKTEMKQIITNLCRNAEHAFEGDSGQIDISLTTKKPSRDEKANLDIIANEFAVISVKDNGSGIEKENLKKIFEPLFTTKEVGEGTGLGLSVVIGIVRSWGGAIDVKSVLGKGTEFQIYIPLHKNSDDFSDLMDIIEDLES